MNLTLLLKPKLQAHEEYKKAILRGGFFIYLNEVKNKEDKYLSQFTAFGLIAGVIFGLLTDNLGLWIALGVAIGAGIGFVKVEKRKDGLE